MEQIRRDIGDFKEKSGVNKVIVLWTANTERFVDVKAGVNDTTENLLATIQVTYRHIMSNTDQHDCPAPYYRVTIQGFHVSHSCKL